MAASKNFFRFLNFPSFATKTRTLASDLSLREMTICDFKDPKSLEKWSCASDEEFGGYSKVELVRTKTDHVSFRGVLSTDRPRDKVVKHSGFCAMRSKPLLKYPDFCGGVSGENALNMKRFVRGVFPGGIRATPLLQTAKHSEQNRWGTALNTDLSSYDVIQLRMRGDGRTYAVNMQPPGYNTDDMYQAFIYTRGGPLWEVVTIPFSKFLFTTAGYLQDRQPTFHCFKTIGISLMDRINGPFCLELDYIRVRETFYQPKYFVEQAMNELEY